MNRAGVGSFSKQVQTHYLGFNSDTKMISYSEKRINHQTQQLSSALQGILASLSSLGLFILWLATFLVQSYCCHQRCFQTQHTLVEHLAAPLLDFFHQISEPNNNEGA